MTTKINQTETYNDFIVVKGKLVLMKDIPDGNIYVNGVWYKSIIISETEKIEVGDYVLHKLFGHNPEIKQTKDVNFIPQSIYSTEYSYKILALPKNFSFEILQDIVNGKLKDGDEFYVECEAKGDYELAKFLWNKFIKLSSNNHIKLFPIKKAIN